MTYMGAQAEGRQGSRLQTVHSGQMNTPRYLLFGVMFVMGVGEVQSLFFKSSLSNPQLLSSLHLNVSNVRGVAKVGGDGKGVKHLGDYSSFEECAAAFRNYSAFNPLWEMQGGIQCRSFSFFHLEHASWNGNSKWAGQCFAVVDERWEKHAENHVTTSRVCLVDREVLSDCLEPSCNTDSCFSCPVIFRQEEEQPKASAKKVEGPEANSEGTRWDLVD